VSAGPLIVAEQVSKRFYLHRNRTHSMKERFLSLFHERHRMQSQEFWALRDLSVAIGAGEAVGLVGRNGSGKSTLLKLIAGIHTPTSGRLLVRAGARIGSMIELGVGFHPELTGRENVYLNASVYGLTRGDVDRIYDGVVDYAEIGPFLDEPIKNYSSGMVVRLGFAVAAHLDPDVLLLDEIFAVGDAEFQEKCIRTMQAFVAAGKTIVFVSHSAQAVRQMCQRVCVLSHGSLLFDGPVDDGLALYEGLMHAEAAQAAASVPLQGR
jgi:ABC-type polysaccharide/polyol phosphate transport system ATPase subunit